MSTRLAHLTVRGNQLTLRVPYAPEFLADFKIIVPYAQRSWSAGSKTWQIQDCYLEVCCKTALIDLCERHFDQLIVLGEKPPAAISQTSDWAVLMFAAMPAQLHRAVYRALSRVLHPDVGGDLMAMKQITAAYAARKTAA